MSANNSKKINAETWSFVCNRLKIHHTIGVDRFKNGGGKNKNTKLWLCYKMCGGAFSNFPKVGETCAPPTIPWYTNAPYIFKYEVKNCRCKVQYDVQKNFHHNKASIKVKLLQGA